MNLLMTVDQYSAPWLTAKTAPARHDKNQHALDNEKRVSPENPSLYLYLYIGRTVFQRQL